MWWTGHSCESESMAGNRISHIWDWTFKPFPTYSTATGCATRTDYRPKCIFHVLAWPCCWSSSLRNREPSRPASAALVSLSISRVPPLYNELSRTLLSCFLIKHLGKAGCDKREKSKARLTNSARQETQQMWQPPIIWHTSHSAMWGRIKFWAGPRHRNCCTCCSSQVK